MRMPNCSNSNRVVICLLLPIIFTWIQPYGNENNSLLVYTSLAKFRKGISFLCIFLVFQSHMCFQRCRIIGINSLNSLHSSRSVGEGYLHNKFVVNCLAEDIELKLTPSSSFDLILYFWAFPNREILFPRG